MNKIITAVTITASLFSTVTLAESGGHFLNKHGLDVYAEGQHEQLQNITLKTAATSQGMIYYSEEAGVFFPGSRPLTEVGNQLDILDRQFIAHVVDSIPNKIVLKAKNEVLRVTMFTDYTCGWCQKVHEDIDSYTNAGITIEFVLFPRMGLMDRKTGEPTVAARAMSTIIDSENPYAMMQKTFKDQYITPSKLSPKIVKFYEMGLGLNVKSTPSFFVNGYPVGGYMAAEAMIKNFVKTPKNK